MIHVLHFAAAGGEDGGIRIEAGVAPQGCAGDHGPHHEQGIGADGKGQGQYDRRNDGGDPPDAAGAEIQDGHHNYPISCKPLGVLYGVDGDLLERQYRNHLSDYLHWDQLSHAENWLLFEKNIGAYVCIDKVALSCGELYTVLINKAAHGGKGSIIGIIKGTDVCTVTSVLLKLSRRRRY